VKLGGRGSKPPVAFAPTVAFTSRVVRVTPLAITAIPPTTMAGRAELVERRGQWRLLRGVAPERGVRSSMLEASARRGRDDGRRPQPEHVADDVIVPDFPDIEPRAGEGLEGVVDVQNVALLVFPFAAAEDQEFLGDMPSRRR